MAIPGHDLVVTRHPSNPLLMRADCTCGRRADVWYSTFEAMEKSYGLHIARIARLAIIALGRIEAAMTSTSAEGGPAAVQKALADFRSAERW